MYSKIFSSWAEEAHKQHIVSEIDQIDRRDILNQLSASDSNSDTVHNLEEVEIRENSKREFIRNIKDDLIDLEADPKTEVPEEISPNSASNLERRFPQL